MNRSVSSSRVIWAAFLCGASWNALPAADRATTPAPQEAARRAAVVLEASPSDGGLVVHLGCGDGRLTAALRANDRLLVHGLDENPAHVDRARSHIRSRGLYGPVSVEVWSGKTLPYSDNLVNLVVVDTRCELPDAGSEILRVLAPRGVAVVRETGNEAWLSRIPHPVSRIGDGWAMFAKPVPVEMDEWSHFLHDASNNAVAQDSLVGPPKRLKWTCEPLWSRSHEFNSSLVAMVSAEGRIFYIFDEGLTGVTTASLPERWTLIARDAFNGVLLWKRPLPDWGTAAWRNKALRSVPPTVPRRLVAQGDRVFMTLGYDAPISVIDAATGEILSTLEATQGTDEIRCVDEVLLAVKRDGVVVALDSRTGKQLWQASGKIQKLSLAADAERVFYQDGPTVICVGLRDGKPLWRGPGQSRGSMLVAHDDLLLVCGRQTLQALSVETGEIVWETAGGVPRNELFVARGRAWHWSGEGMVGRDLKTGRVTETVDPSEVFTPGHHLRCYQSKATENYIITPYRGVEFVSVTGQPHAQCDWTRGPCRFGIMPCNGLLYVPPNPCFCYPGVKIAGFNALAGGEPRAESGEPEESQLRLTRGPAYEELGARNSERGTEDSAADSSLHTPSIPHSDFRIPHSSWATYRGDARRSGASSGQVAAEVAEKWRVTLEGRLTPPVAAGGTVFVAEKDAHTLHALSLGDGQRRWQFTAAGRIDSPPTVHGPLVLFGCADGCVYCLRAADGQLVWRFRAAPSPERIVAFGQLESPWRVHGSVLLTDGVAYCTAGRSSYLDGGIWLYGLDPASGNVLYEARVDDWSRTRDDAVGKPFVPGYHMEGCQSDILVCEGDYIFLGQEKFDRQLRRQEVPYILADPNEKTVTMDLSQEAYIVADEDPKKDYEKVQRDWIENTQKGLLAKLRAEHGSYNLGDRRMGRHVFSTAGFLDDSWFNRTYWMYSETWPGFYIAHRGAKTGHLLVVGPEKTYAVTAYPSRNLQSPLFTPGEKGYLLIADRNENEPVLDDRTRGTTKGWGFTRQEPPVWHQWLPVRVRAMVLAGQHLFVAGPPDVVDPDDPMATFEGRGGAVLRILSAAEGKTLFEKRLDAPPVFDGLIAADGHLLMSTTNGHVLCLSK